MRSDLVIVLNRLSDFGAVLGEICSRNGVIHEVDVDHGVIEATLESEHIPSVQKMEGVAYVRPVLSYCDAA